MDFKGFQKTAKCIKHDVQDTSRFLASLKVAVSFFRSAMSVNLKKRKKVPRCLINCCPFVNREGLISIFRTVLVLPIPLSIRRVTRPSSELQKPFWKWVNNDDNNNNISRVPTLSLKAEQKQLK